MRAFVEAVDRHYPPEANGWTPLENRRAYDALCKVFRQARPAGVSSADGTWSFDKPNRSLRFRRYRPHSPPPGENTALLYLHGGGFVVGGLDSHDDICAELCARTGMAVTALDYRLAPEHVYPAALDDVEGAYRCLLAESGRVLVAGDSAGGTLAAALTLRLRRLGLPQAIGQVLIYPALGPVRAAGSYRQWKHAPMLRSSDCAHYLDLYGGGAAREHENDPEFLPLMAEDFSGLPAAWVVTGDVDPVRDDGRDYVSKLVAEGVSAAWRNEPGLVHSYLRARASSRRAAASFTAIVEAIGRLAREHA
jgi:acetyl esterase